MAGSPAPKGSQSGIFTGARAVVKIEGQTMGIFSNVTWSYDLSVEPAYILGAFGPQDLAYTAQDVVRIDASGWRVVNDTGGNVQQTGGSPYQGVGGNKLVPTLSDLLKHQDMTFEILDRSTNVSVIKVIGVRPSGHRGGVSARQLSEMSIPFVGLAIGDALNTSPAESGNDVATFP